MSRYVCRINLGKLLGRRIVCRGYVYVCVFSRFVVSNPVEIVTEREIEPVAERF